MPTRQLGSCHSSDAHHARYGGEHAREILFHLIAVEAPVLKVDLGVARVHVRHQHLARGQ
eukprot:scaffold42066_cov67-Phaeocystis_antarctica.AAC.2